MKGFAKRMLALVCGIVMLFTCMTACNKESEEVGEITIFVQADENPEQTYENNSVLNYWQKQQGITEKWQQPLLGTEQEQFSLMVSSGEYTDVVDISYKSDTLTALYEAGMLRDLSEYVEEYMPNYYAFINAPENIDVKNAVYTKDGKLFNIVTIKEAPKLWGGLVWRKDILTAMTGGNIEFPSGNSEPTTIADYEYMLPLFQAYYDYAGEAYVNRACFMLPAVGYYATGEFLGAFGIGGHYYLDNGTVKFGIAQDAFYDYLTTMKQWYANGWVYQDFATNGGTFMTAPAEIVYSGAAGCWFTFSQMLGDGMKQYVDAIEWDVQPVAAPKQADGSDPIGVYTPGVDRASENSGFAIATACSDVKMKAIMQAFDWFYTEEGAVTRTMGLSSEQGAAEEADYIRMGITNGTREPNSRVWTAEMDVLKEKNAVDFAANRMPGIEVDYPARSCELDANGNDWATIGHNAWTKYGDAAIYPQGAIALLSAEDSARANEIYQLLQDYADNMIPKFIMGTEELNETTFAAYQAQLESLGLSELMQIYQAGYDEYLTR